MKNKSILIGVCVCVAVAAIFVPLIGRGDGGYISLEGPGATVRLSGGLFCNVTLRPGAEPRKVPAKKYAPKWLTLVAEKGGDIWRLQSAGSWGELAQVEVERDKTTVIKLGPPLQIKPETTVRGRDVSVGLAILGQAGERYRNVMTVNGGSMPEPKVKIIDQDGNVLASGRFEYG